MNKKLLLSCLVIAAMSMPACKNKNKNQPSGGDQDGGTVLPDAPLESIHLALANFKFDEALPEPSLTGLTAENVQIAYTYLNGETDAEIGSYAAGGTGTIVPGSYKLKASVTSSTYKPFALTVNFTVSLAEFDEKYAISTDSLNLGVTQSNYDINAVNLNELLAINVVATSTALEGTSFAWKQDYSSFVSGTPFDAIVVASKEHFAAKEYTVHVSSTKAAVAIPKLHKPGNAADNFDLDYTYTGSAQAVEYVDFDSTNVEVVAASVSEATNAATYNVEFKLKNPNRCTWSDSTTTNKSFEWTINPATMSIDMVAKDYDYDDLKPAPTETGVPAGTQASYKYYKVSSQKYDYVPGTVNDILPDSYTLEATYTNPNYETYVTTCYFVVSAAQFDEAYALSTNEINVGQLDVGYDLSTVNLNNHLAMNVVATSAALDGVTFTWKQAYAITGGDPLNATVIAHKEGFADKEFDITVNSTKKLVNMPELFGGESGTNPVGYLSYNESEQKVHLEGLDETRVDIVAESVFYATNAGVYHVEVSLKDPSHTCWSDSTTANLSWNWEIHKFFVSGSSTGYRIKIGGYTGIVSQTVIKLDPSIVSDPCELHFDFRNQSYDYEEYTYAAFEIPNSSSAYSHIDGEGRLVVDEIHNFDIVAKTSNPNHQFSQTYNISFEAAPSLRTLTFTPTKDAADVNGLDRTEIVPNAVSSGDHSNYLFRANLGGNGARLSKQFKSVKSVSITINWTEELYPSSNPFSVKVYLSPNTDYVGTEDDVKVNHTFNSSNETIEYDFNEKTFNPLIDYYFLMWFGGSGGGSVNITSLVVVYQV